jgi:hypothetical protein
VGLGVIGSPVLRDVGRVVPWEPVDSGCNDSDFRVGILVGSINGLSVGYIVATGMEVEEGEISATVDFWPTTSSAKINTRKSSRIRFKCLAYMLSMIIWSDKRLIPSRSSLLFG